MDSSEVSLRIAGICSKNNFIQWGEWLEALGPKLSQEVMLEARLTGLKPGRGMQDA